MLNYEEFKGSMEEQILEHLPEEYADYKVNIKKLVKVNREVDELELVAPEREYSRSTLCIDLNELYKDYLKNGDFFVIMNQVVREIMNASKYITENENRLDNILGDFYNKVVVMLVNTKMNEEMLKSVPHHEFHDLSVVCGMFIDASGEYHTTARINNSFIEAFKLNEQELFEKALENTRRLYPPMIKRMDNMLTDLMKLEMPEEWEEMISKNSQMDEAHNMYVLTNSIKFCGATTLLYEDQLHDLAEKLGSDLYILPSSIHELIAIPVELAEVEVLANMVKDVNSTVLPINEKLSDQVYHYDKKLRKVTLATEIPNKKLDGHDTKKIMNRDVQMGEPSLWNRKLKM